MGSVISDLDDEVDELEDKLLGAGSLSANPSVNRFRRTVLALRRYLALQREAITSLQRESDGLL